MPVYPWPMLHRADAKHPGLATLVSVVTELSRAEDWTLLPEDAWIPE